jgi:AraC-like DNA-binding protein
MHITHEWGDDGPRHGFALPKTLVHGVVERVFHPTISERGAVTGRVQSVDDELFSEPIHLDDDVDAASARLDELIGAHSELDPTYVSLTSLVDRIRDDDRLHRVEQVMAHSPWSARTTQRVFRRYVGVPVKWVLCRYRLQQAALEIESHPGVDHADLAVSLGWYDQAHFITDFRTMLGSTPGEYAAAHGS